jgi:hypothetical protein
MILRRRRIRGLKARGYEGFDVLQHTAPLASKFAMMDDSSP